MTALPSQTKAATAAPESLDGRPDRDEERRLVQRAIDRDQGAFAELYDRHVVRVYRHIYYLVGDASVAEDLTAQTFL